MADMVPVVVTGVVRGTEEGPRRERFFVEVAAAAEGDGRRLRIGLGDAEAQALACSLRGTEFPRPTTYQLMASLVGAAGSAVRSVFDEVTLDQLVNGEFPEAIRVLFDSEDAWTPRLGPQVPSIPRGADPEWRI